jgi:hypothetical protein
VSRTLNRALRETTAGSQIGSRLRRALGTFKSFSLRADPTGGLSIGIEVAPEEGRADTGSLEVDLADLAIDLAAAAGDLFVGTALFIDEMQDLRSDELAALCHACHEAGQQDAQFYTVGLVAFTVPGMAAFINRRPAESD